MVLLQFYVSFPCGNWDSKTMGQYPMHFPYLKLKYYSGITSVIIVILKYMEVILQYRVPLPWQKSTEVNCSKTIVFEVILQFTIVNYSNTTIYNSITIVLLDTIALLPYT